jgi:hypothetical protein
LRPFRHHGRFPRYGLGAVHAGHARWLHLSGANPGGQRRGASGFHELADTCEKSAAAEPCRESVASPVQCSGFPTKISRHAEYSCPVQCWTRRTALAADAILSVDVSTPG